MYPTHGFYGVGRILCLFLNSGIQHPTKLLSHICHIFQEYKPNLRNNYKNILMESMFYVYNLVQKWIIANF
jgi:hypothetical protein